MRVRTPVFCVIFMYCVYTYILAADGVTLKNFNITGNLGNKNGISVTGNFVTIQNVNFFDLYTGVFTNSKSPSNITVTKCRAFGGNLVIHAISAISVFADGTQYL